MSLGGQSITPSREHDADLRRLSADMRRALDAGRAIAAIYVVLHHLSAANRWPRWLDLALSFGQEAVIVFFLLSGFVIFYNEHTRLASWRGYYLRRLRRVYPTLLLALGVSSLVALVDEDFSEQFSWAGLGSTLLSLQDIAALKPGVISDPYLSNDPLWSLSYEIAFYVVFPPLMILWRRSPLLLVNLVGGLSVVGYVSYLAWPNHFSLVASYLAIWWLGCALAYIYIRGRSSRLTFITTLAWVMVLTAVAGVGVRLYGFSGLGQFPFLPFRHFAFSGSVALLVVSPLRSHLVRLLAASGRPGALAARYSFELYVFHFPILVQSQLSNSSLGLLAALVVLTVVCVGGQWTIDRLVPLAPRR